MKTNQILALQLFCSILFGIAILSILLGGAISVQSSAARMDERMEKMANATERAEQRVDALEKQLRTYADVLMDVDPDEVRYWLNALRYARQHKFIEKSVDTMNRMYSIDLVEFNTVINESAALVHRKLVEFDPFIQMAQDPRWRSYFDQLHLVNWTEVREEVTQWAYVVNEQRQKFPIVLDRGSDALAHFNRLAQQLETREVIRLVGNTTAHLVSVVEYMEHLMEKLREL